MLSFIVFTFPLNMLYLSALNDFFLTPGNKDKEMGILSPPLIFLLLFPTFVSIIISSLYRCVTFMVHSVTISPTLVYVLYIFKYVHCLLLLVLLLIFQSSLHDRSVSSGKFFRGTVFPKFLLFKIISLFCFFF